jgi:hypothetical protein
LTLVLPKIGGLYDEEALRQLIPTYFKSKISVMTAPINGHQETRYHRSVRVVMIMKRRSAKPLDEATFWWRLPMGSFLRCPDSAGKRADLEPPSIGTIRPYSALQGAFAKRLILVGPSEGSEHWSVEAIATHPHTTANSSLARHNHTGWILILFVHTPWARGRKLIDSGCFRLKFCPYTRHKYYWSLPCYNGIPSDRISNGLMHKLKILNIHFSYANGDWEGENRPLEWKLWNCD